MTVNPFSPRRSSSIAVSTAISAVAALLILVGSVFSSIVSVSSIETSKRQETLRYVLQHYGNSLGRELKVQTFWSEGYKNTRDKNVEWMKEFYGPYLDKLLGYTELYVLDGSDQSIYGYREGSNSVGTEYESVRGNMADLVLAVRATTQAVSTAYRVQEAVFDLGNNQVVTHRYVADIRSVNGVAYIVVVSTILPDSAQNEPIEAQPFLMVAMNPVSQSILETLGGNFGFKKLQWGVATGSGYESLKLQALNGHPVGQLHWLSDNPGWDLGIKMLPGLALAGMLMVGLGVYLVRRNYAQAASLERYSRRLAEANDALEKRVDARTQELEAIFENVAQGVVLVGPGQKIIIANLQARQLMELDSDATLQEEIDRLDCSMKPVTDERRNLPDGTIRQDLIRASGRIVEVRKIPLPEGRSVLTISDVSALKKRQAELEAAINAANAANLAKSRFLSTMSHEMRTPLNGVIGALELIGKTNMTSDQKQLIDLAGKSSEALLVHINDVLDFSKLEAEKFELTTEPFDLIRATKTVRDIVRSQADHRNNRLVIDIAPDVPRHVMGDAVRVRQILLNLVSNANKFTRDGSITVQVHVASGSPASPTIEFAVKDTGAGIAADKLHTLFKEFSMIESEYKRSGGGTGLGLAISKRLSESMGGTISVESVVGEGSVFRVRIPFNLAEGITLGDDSADDAGEAAIDPLFILLVDDNATNRLVGSRLLESAGHTVTTAENGKLALDLASRVEFDLILMDVSMPEMDGLEATTEIRKLPAPHSRVPIIALTANAVIGDREKFMSVGMNDYVSKPFRLHDLQEKLRKHTSQRRVAEERSHATTNDSDANPMIDEAELSLLAEATSRETVALIVDEYVGELRGRQSTLADAIAKQDFASIQKICHAISGSSRSVGAARLAACARTIELACIALEANASTPELSQIDAVIEETVQVYESYSRRIALQSAA